TRLQVDLDIALHATCRRYTDFRIRCAYTRPYAVLLAMLFGVEASYLAAWSALAPSGPYTEFMSAGQASNLRRMWWRLAGLPTNICMRRRSSISMKCSCMSGNFGGCHGRAEAPGWTTSGR